MRRSALLAAVSTVAALAAGCGQAPADDAAATGDGFKTCMVTGSGGINDRSFNAAAWQGLQAAQQAYDVEAKYTEPQAETEYAAHLQQLVDYGCNITFTVGYTMTDATAAAAAQYPDEKYGFVDSTLAEPADNVKPLLFNTAEASYLAGYLAAGVTKTGIVGTYGAEPQPPVLVFMDGFADGVARYNADHKAKVKLIGWDKATQRGTFTGDWEDQNKGRQVTENFLQQGADIVMPVAANVGLGSVAAAKDSDGKLLIVWVDSDGYTNVPASKEVFLTSVLKGIGKATETVTKETLDGKFTNTPYIGTLANGGVSIAPFHDHADDVPAALQQELKDLEQQIIDGKIVVTSKSAPTQ